MWQPSMQELNEVISLINDSFSCNNLIQEKVTKRISEFNKFDKFHVYLVHIIFNFPSNLEKKHLIMALTMLKNYLKQNYQNMSEDQKIYIKQELCKLFEFQYLPVFRYVGNILATICSEDLEYAFRVVPIISELIDRGLWPDVKVYFTLLDKIYEDVSYSTHAGLSDVIPSLVQILLKYFSSQTPEIRVMTLICLKSFIPNHYEIILSSSVGFFQIFLQMLNETDNRTRCSVAAVLVTISDVYYSAIIPYTDIVFNFICSCMVDTYDTALEATEFWVSALHSREGKESMRGFLPKLVPIVLSLMKYTQFDAQFCDYEEKDHMVEDPDIKFIPDSYDTLGTEGDDIDDNNNWTLRKCAATTLDSFATKFGAEIGPNLTPINSMLVSPDWRDQEAAILALGAIANGCCADVNSYFPSIFPTLTDKLNHEIGLVRGIAAWTLSKYTRFYNKSPDYYQLLFPLLIKKLTDPNKYTQANVISCFIALAYDSTSSVMLGYLDDFSRKSIECFSYYKRKNLSHLFYLIGLLSEIYPDFTHRAIFTKELLPRMLTTFTSNHEFTPLDIALSDAIISVCKTMSTSFVPFAEPLLKCCVQNIEQGLNQCAVALNDPAIPQPNPQYIVAFLNVLSVLFEHLSRELSEQIVNYRVPRLLLASLSPPFTHLRQHSAACVGDLARTCFPTLQNDVEAFVKLLVEIRPDDTPYTVNNLIWALTMVITKLGPNSVVYFDFIMHSIVNSFQLPSVQKCTMDNMINLFMKLNLICSGRMSVYLPYITETWSKSIYRSSSLQLKLSSSLTLLSLLTNDPKTTIENIHKVFDSISLSVPPGPEIISALMNLLSSVQRHISAQEWQSITQSISPQLRERLASSFGIHI